jgi:hypothetical protein
MSLETAAILPPDGHVHDRVDVVGGIDNVAALEEEIVVGLCGRRGGEESKNGDRTETLKK